MGGVIHVIVKGGFQIILQTTIVIIVNTIGKDIGKFCFKQTF